MSGGTLIIVGVAGILAVLSGWLVPIIFKSPRPYGLLGDILVCTALTVVLSYLAWQWIMPALGFKTGWIAVAGSIGDPLALGWVGLWILRKIKS
jgi:membrane associated rhomboid family serine protease